MFGLLFALCIIVPLMASGISKSSSFMADQKTARELGKETFSSIDGKGPGTFSTKTGRRVYSDPHTKSWRDVKTGTYVCDDKRYNHTGPRLWSDEWYKKEAMEMEKKNTESKMRAIKNGDVFYYTTEYEYPEHPSIGKKLKKRLVCNDLEITEAHGSIHGMYREKKYLLYAYFDENNCYWVKENNGLFANGVELRQQMINDNTKMFTEWIASDVNKLDEMLEYCGKYNIPIDKNKIAEEAKKYAC